jgi:hypothetical protein
MEQEASDVADVSDVASEDSDKNIVQRELNEQEDLEEKFG